MADLLGTDEFLVNRNDVTYTQEQETLMATLQDTDHLLINRAGQTYKITGSDLINSVIDPLEVTVILAPTDGYTDTAVTAVPVVSGGKQPDGGYIFSYQWVTADDASGTNKANIPGETGATFTPDNAQVGKYLGCVVSTTDALGTTAEGEAYIGPIQVLAQAPVIADVVVSEIYDGTNRFTDKEFPYVTTMAIDGEPNPTYEVKAKLSGTTFDFDVKSDAITDVEGEGVITCETELIESVSSQSTSSLYVMDATPSSLSDVLANGTPYQEGAEIEFGEYLVRVNNEGPITGNVFDANLPVLGLYDAADSTTGCFGEFGTQIPTLAGSYAQTEWTLMELKDEAPNTAAFSYYTFFTDSSVSYQVFRIGAPSNSAGETDSLPALAAGSLTTLTFPSAQGFGCFEPGDVVQGSADSATALIGTWAGSYDDAGSETTLTKGQSYAISGSSTYWFFEDTAPSNLVVQKSDSAANGLYIVGFTTSSEIGNNGTVLYTGDGPFEISFGSTPYVQVYGGGNGESSFQLSSEGDVKVISKDDSDPYTITVDGGEWYGSDGSGDAGNTTYHQPANEWSTYGSLLINPGTGWGDWSNVFNETDSSQGGGAGSGIAETSDTITWVPPVDKQPVGTTVTVWYTFTSAPSAGEGLKINGVLQGTTNNNNTNSIDYTINGALESVVLSGTVAKYLFGIYIDGKKLVNASVPGVAQGDTKLVNETPYDTILTLAGSENFDLLTAGTSVKMGLAADVPYQPISDLIVSVASMSWVNSGDWNASGPSEYMFDQSLQTFAFAETNQSASVSFQNVIAAKSIRIYGYAGGLIGPNPSAGEGQWFVKANDNEIMISGGSYLPEGTSTVKDWVDLSSDFTFPCTLQEVRTAGSQGGISAIEIDGELLGSSRTTLTLASDTDLAYFREGDVVQGVDGTSITEVAAKYTPLAGGMTGNDINTFSWSAATNRPSGDLTLNTNFDENGEVFAVYSPTPFKATAGRVTPSAAAPMSLAASDDGESWFVVDWKADPGYQDPSKWLESSTAHKYFALYRADSGTQNLVGANMDGGYSFGGAIDDAVKVISIDESVPSITVDGGKWGNANQSQVWSSLGSFSSTGQAAVQYSEMFDGDAPSVGDAMADNNSNGWRIGGIQTAAGTATVSGLNIPFTSSVKVKYVKAIYGGNNSDAPFRINGVDVLDSTATDETVREMEVGSLITSPITSWEIERVNGGSNNLVIYEISIDGKILVDAVNDSQVWSSKVSTDGTTPDYTLGFDGDTSTRINSEAGKYLLCDFTNLGLSGNLRVFMYKSDANTLSINGGTPIDTNTGFDFDWVDYGDVGTINTLKFQGAGGTGAQFNAIEVDGKLILDQGVRDLGDSEVTCISPLKAPTDWTVVESDSTANTLTLSAAVVDNSQVWVANDNRLSTDFFVEPTNAVPIQQDYAWGKLQIINNKAQVTGIQKDDPGFLPVPAKDYSIKFPAVFPTGNEPDVDLPRGTCVSAIVAAENSEGRSVKESNCFMPIDVNPEGAAGPITATTPTQLTVASSANLSEFSPGDNLVMVDENNDISDYTIISDSIVSVAVADYGSQVIQTKSCEPLFDGDPTTNVQIDITQGKAGTARIVFNPPLKASKTFSFYQANSDLETGGYDKFQGFTINDIDVNDERTLVNDSNDDFRTTNRVDWDLNNLGITEIRSFDVFYTTESSAGERMYGFRADGVIVTGGFVTLTLASDQDFAYFRVGDVVQSNLYSPGFVETAFEHSERAFNGDATTIASNAAIARNDYIKWKSAKLLSGNISVYTRANTSINQDVTVKLLAADNSTVIAQQTVSANADAIVEVAFAGVSDVKYIYVNDDTGASTKISYIYSIKVNGSLLIDEVKIISIDESVPSITVDGGEWYSSNDSQVWSDVDYQPGDPSQSSRDSSPTFDGDLATYSGAIFVQGDTRPTTYTFANPPSYSDKVRIYADFDLRSDDDPYIKINGVAAPTSGSAGIGGPNRKWYTVLTGSGTVNTIEILASGAGYAAHLHAVEVDGKILVDTVYDSQVWSNYGTSDYVDGALFDGDLTTYGGGSFDYQFGTDGPTATSSIEVYFDTPNVYANTVTINGSANLVPLTQGTQWVDVTAQVGLGQITSIIGTHSSGSTTGLLGVKIDGKLMMDQGVRDLGATKLVKETSYEASITCSDSTELANMVGPISMTDANGDLVTPQTSEITGVVDSDYAANTTLNGYTAIAGRDTDLLYNGLFGGTNSYPWSTTNDGSNFPATEGVYIPVPISAGDEVKLMIVNNGTTNDFLVSRDRVSTHKVIPGRPNGSADYEVDISDVFATQGSSAWAVGSKSNANLSYIKVNGVIVTDTHKILTFADNTDLEYFQAGDVVQSDWNQNQDWSSLVTPVPRTQDPASNAFDSTTNGPGCIAKFPGDGGTGSATFAPSGFNGGSVRLTGFVAGGGTSLTVNGSSASFDTDITFTGDLVIVWTSIDGFNYTRLDSITVNGKLLVDQAISDPSAISVVSVDAASSQMVVDGGTWDTSNQSEVWSQTRWVNVNDTGWASNRGPDKAFNGAGPGDYANTSVALSNSPIEFLLNGEFSGTWTAFVGGQREVYVDSTQVHDGTSGGLITFSTTSSDQKITFRENTSAAPDADGAIAGQLTFNGRLLVDQGVSGLGDTSVSKDPLEASATDVIGVDGNTLQIDGVSGTWKTGLRIKGASISSSAPSPSSVVFTSMNGGTTPVTGTDASLTSRVWTLEKSNAQNGPWTVVGEFIDTSANASQDGATPWSGKPDLEPNTYYQVKVAYNSDNASSIESTFNTFKTGDA